MIEYLAEANKNQKIVLPDGRYVFFSQGEEEDAYKEVLIEVPYDGVYGFGEKFDAINQKGKLVENVVIEKFCNQNGKTYCSVPFCFTDSGLGLYADTLKRTVFDLRNEGMIRCRIPKDVVLQVFTGTPCEILQEWNKDYKPQRSLPSYVFGPWISANRWNKQEDVYRTLGLLKKHHIPATVLVLEAWSDETTFYIFNGASYTGKENGEAFCYEDFDFSKSSWPDPKKMIEDLKREGIATILWQIPVYKKCTKDEETTQSKLDEKYALEHKLCVYKEDGTPYRIPEGNWFAGALIPDFTRKETRDNWMSKRKYLLDMGVAGFKTDGGEFIYREDLVFSDGKTGREMKNGYCQSYVDTYYDALDAENVLFSRAGSNGVQRTPVLWAGDHQSTNDELKHVYYAGISAACSGILFWGFDIGGFAGALPSKDLYLRSTMFACFCPVMQWHSEPDGGQFKELLAGAEGNNERSPWNMAAVYEDPDFLREIRYWHRLRMNMISYLTESADLSVQTGLPMMMPLFMLDRNDPALKQMEDEYMLGAGVLVAPLLEENQTGRKVYLPKGNWVGLFSGQEIPGNRWVDSANEKFPVYVRKEEYDRGRLQLPDDI